jgi:hypothetical protein
VQEGGGVLGLGMRGGKSSWNFTSWVEAWTWGWFDGKFFEERLL